jgi:hypothetical protein
MNQALPSVPSEAFFEPRINAKCDLSILPWSDHG